ncbi:DNA methyltransferase [Embleya sp. AB8]|uniref:class I SAM-dependent methyltransferase n=1 Tax=Embleya sp. AB8 TaxID=3156304 RepID=UPI003C7410F6
MPLSDVQTSAKRSLSPKRPAVEKVGLADVFPYYAGFSFDWACDKLASGSPSDSPITVLDPWNGSGTTTLAAQHLGHRAIGIDRNPVANLIARLRSQTTSQGLNIRAPEVGVALHSPRDDDPLCAWFTATTVERIRDWVQEIRGSGNDGYALGMIALFRAIRLMTRQFEGSNPTWVKRAKNAEERLVVSSDDVDALLQAEILFVSERLSTQPEGRSSALLVTADSANLPLQSGIADVVLTSPPYLTRIDYAVAYVRELAVLGFDISVDRRIRLELMGTTLTREENKEGKTCIGEASTSLLEKIEKHASKASSGYYLKQARQYLSDLTLGLDEIGRVSKENARLHLVVQDSFYKDVHVPLADICIDESIRRGWTLESCERFPVRRTLTSLNTSAKAYKKGDVDESVITFARRSSV